MTVSGDSARGKQNILVVDDEQDISLVCKLSLERQGYNVDSFSDPKAALACDARKYDLAILDIKMPEVSGFDLAHELWRRNEHLQVCFISAFEITESEMRAKVPGFESYCFLKKPFSIDKLARHVKEHFLQH